MSSLRAARHALIASIVLAAAAPVATWSVVGDLSSPGITDPDYMFRPLDIPGPVELVLGLVATAAVLGSVWVLVRAFHRGEVDRAWSPVVVFPAVAGVVAGFSWRVLTAGGIGANIGGGLILLGAPFVVVALITATVASGSAARRGGR